MGALMFDIKARAQSARTISVLFVAVTATSITMACGTSTQESLPTDSLIPAERLAWVQANALELESIEPGDGFYDLEALRGIFDGARIIALGVVSPGTRESALIHHRLIEYLSAELGFSLVALEARPENVALLGRYVSHGNGDPVSWLSLLESPNFVSEETLRLVEWMRAGHETDADRITLVGFDVHDAPAAIAIDGEFISEHAEEFREGVSTDPDSAPSAWPDPSQREAGMALGIERIVERNAGAGIVILAHNEHIARDSGRLGSYLAERFGEEYVSIAFSTYAGPYNAGNTAGRRAFSGLDPIPNDLEFILAEAGLPRYVVDLKQARAGAPDTSWLMAQGSSQVISPQMGSERFGESDIALRFDALVYLDETQSVTPLTR